MKMTAIKPVIIGMMMKMIKLITIKGECNLQETFHSITLSFTYYA